MMKKLSCLLAALMVILCFLAGCHGRDMDYIIDYEPRFQGIVLSIEGDYAKISLDPEDPL